VRAAEAQVAQAPLVDDDDLSEGSLDPMNDSKLTGG
jgi:hypothetical protein